MRAILAQLSPKPGDLEANEARLVDVVTAHPDADVAVFPELFLSGYETRHAVRCAFAADGREFEGVRRAAADARTVVLVGFSERLDSGAIANSLACINQEGVVRGVYRKTHLFGEESSTFEAGDSLLVVELLGWRLAPLICFDIEFPEPARACALAGADVLITASANMAPHRADHRIAAQARALENRLPHLYVNRCGDEGGVQFVGGTCAIDADGTVIAEAIGTGEEILRVDVPPAYRGDSRVDYLLHRRGMLPVTVSTSVARR